MEAIILGSGSSGNAMLVRSGSACVLVDAGLSARQIVTRMAGCGVTMEDVTGILLTHEHGDHTTGLKTLLSKHEMPVYCNPLTAESLRRGGLAGHNNWKFFSIDEFAVGDLVVRPFKVPHDAADPVGFVISDGSVAVGVLTDLGYAPPMVLDSLVSVNALLIEANYDEARLQKDTKRPWAVKQRILSRHGHLSNAAAAEVIAHLAAGALRQVWLGHLSRDCNAPELAEGVVVQRLHSTGRTDITIHCARQDSVSPVFEII